MGDPGHSDAGGGDLRLRHATRDDIPAIREVIRRSWLGLGPRRYTTEQVEATLVHGGVGVDPQLVEDRTYFVVEAGGELVAGGGWSDREKLFGRGEGVTPKLDPATGFARIRAFFVVPEWSGRGVGGMVLAHCERAAMAAGFRRFVLGATLTGEPFYARHGYVAVEPFDAELGGVAVPMVRMEKEVGA